MKQTNLRAAHAWSPDGWRSLVLDCGADGRLAAPADTDSDPATAHWVLPGMANLHSHAFQRAMAGLAERRSGAADSFWSWRETMYAFAERITPDDLQAIAAQLYVEMLRAGYTHVCEFHYLHHAPDGRPYADPAAMSRAIIAAAREAGIGLTLLPVLYMRGGFDGRALSSRQTRFGHDVDAFLRLLDDLRREEDASLRVGMAFHSLRAVLPEAMAATLAALPDDTPRHVHIAEQTAEVDDCMAVRGARPVRWLLDHANVDAHWTLVHATHLDDAEVQGIARSGATVAICPTTEANLGDGLFPLRDYLDAGGAWGVGSDSHISVSPVEELRWLEYGQRLRTRSRNVAADASTPSVGETLLRAVASSAADATGVPIGSLECGRRADWIVLDENAPELAARGQGDVLDSWIFSGNRPLVREVVAAGRRVVENGHHIDEDRIASRYRACVQRLAGAMRDDANGRSGV
ncbi:MAG: formimidoylglutamate deiminase [Proteobacteria bacterium]|nr:formimidoylglutamate deiminase [Pseudomonadota bacterium]